MATGASGDADGTIGSALSGAAREVVDGSGELLVASGSARTGPSLAGLAPGSGFRLDPDAARAAVQRLDAALERLDRELAQASVVIGYRFGFGIDPVSIQLERNVLMMATRAQAYFITWTHQVRATRDALAAHIDGAQATDRANAERLA